MSDPRTVKKNLLQDLMQRARSSTHAGSGGVKFLSSHHASLKGNRSSVKPRSPTKVRTKQNSRKLHFPSVFRSHKETQSLEAEAKTDSLKENAKRFGAVKNKKQSRSQEPEKLPLPRQQQSPVLQPNFDLEASGKQDKALAEKVLQAIVEKHTPQKEKATPVLKQASPKHVLYTTFEDKKLKQLLQTEENITVVPWKKNKPIPASLGRSVTTKASYCSSCGHVGGKTQPKDATTHSLPRKSGSRKDQKLQNVNENHFNSYPRPSKSTKKKNEKGDFKQAPKRVQFKEDSSNSLPQLSSTGNQDISERPNPEETANKSLNFPGKEREKPDKSQSRAVVNKRPSLIRSLSDPTSSPRKEQKPRILYQHKQQLREAKISQINSSRRKTTTENYNSESHKDLEINDLSKWRGEIRTTKATFSGSTTDSDDQHSKTMMSKLKNGNIEDFYPLLKTKIPEEFIQEDGSVTLRSGEGVKKSDADRDSGVDVDTNSCKTLFHQHHTDRDLEGGENDATTTPDSVLEDSSSNGNKKQEFDFDTLKKSHKSTAESSEESSEDYGTLTKHSRKKDEEPWDMYALLKRFECVEWELSPASNLKRQTLDLDNCDLDSVPAAVAEIEYYAFRDVEAVSLNHNNKIENADVLGKLADLRVINMWGCNLKTIPQTWSRLTKLQMLGLGNNQQLANFGPMKHLTNIVWLDLGGCGLKNIPDEVTNMMKLKVLALGGNPGIEIGDEICSLWDLKKLGLNDCELDEIPKPVFSLTKLTHLHVDNNYICHISQEIVHLTELEELTVTGNSNIAFPKILSQCDTIKCIIVDEGKNLTRVSGTLKNRIRQMSTAISPVREPAPPTPTVKQRLASIS